MCGITKMVTGYSIQTYFLYFYAIFISEDITLQRGGVAFGRPCITRLPRIEFWHAPFVLTCLHHTHTTITGAHITQKQRWEHLRSGRGSCQYQECSRPKCYCTFSHSWWLVYWYTGWIHRYDINILLSHEVASQPSCYTGQKGYTPKINHKQI